jgi:hypothetical protein
VPLQVFKSIDYLYGLLSIPILLFDLIGDQLFYRTLKLPDFPLHLLEHPLDDFIDALPLGLNVLIQDSPKLF